MGSIFNYGNQDGFHKMTVEQRHEVRELSEWIRERPSPVSRNNHGQDTKAEIRLAGWRNIKDATMAE